MFFHLLTHYVYRKCDWFSQQTLQITNACYQLTLIWCGLFFSLHNNCLRPSYAYVLDTIEWYMSTYCLLLLCTIYFYMFFNIIFFVRKTLYTHSQHFHIHIFLHKDTDIKKKRKGRDYKNAAWIFFSCTLTRQVINCDLILYVIRFVFAVLLYNMF